MLKAFIVTLFDLLKRLVATDTVARATVKSIQNLIARQTTVMDEILELNYVFSKF